ncbi:extracellular solute-binding protein [Brachybacterium sp. YJGR34]|uniref:extracellular solute-binding protein n=1 Tax=Brachybacterium sp. YJGR34 TaxID=2059911 RepID=UPI00130048C7|nr:extracellular solute-binding protein [Brachybacterium sp. YJGR34]
MPLPPPTRPTGPNIARRTLLAALAMGGTALGASGCEVIADGAVAPEQAELRLHKEPAPGRENTIELFNIWGGRTGNAWVRLAEVYEESQDHTAVRVTYAPLSGGVQIRLQTSIAAGTPPDLAFCTPDEYPQLAGYGVIHALDDYTTAAGISAEQFPEPVWEQMTVTDSIYSIPVLVDVNFPMFWNKKVFAEAGLDPEVPPATIDELDRLSDQILVKDGASATRVGTVPWDYYGYSNSMYTCGFAFGGSFMSDDNEVATPDDPHNIEALTWMCDYAQRIGGASHLAISSPTQTLPSIASGNIGMAVMTTAAAQDVSLNGDPELVELGSALFPYAEGLGQPGSATWLGGYNLFIPEDSENHDMAWDFLQFATMSDEGTMTNWETSTLVPGYTPSPALTELEQDPELAIYHEALFTCRNIRPTIPASGVYTTSLDVNVGAAIYGQLSPADALKKVADQVNTAMDDFRKENS